MNGVIFEVHVAVTKFMFSCDVTPYSLSTSLQARHIPEDSDFYAESV
jgi:hypothetical protein